MTRARIQPRDEAHAQLLAIWREKAALQVPRRAARRASRIAQGRCKDCGKIPVPGRVRCAYHLEKRAEEAARARELKARGFIRDAQARLDRMKETHP